MNTHRTIPIQSCPRRGFTLTEVMAAMTLLSVILLALARMTLVVSERGRANDIAAKRNAALIQQANKFGAMPYDTLTSIINGTNSITTANKTLKSGDFSYTRRLTFATPSTSVHTVKIVIVPTLYPLMIDSVILYRSKPPGSPLCVGC